MRRPWRPVFEHRRQKLRPVFGGVGDQNATVGDDLRLRGRPGADARVQRAAFVIGVAFLGGDFLNHALNPHHPLQFHPVKLQGCVGVASQFVAFAAVVVGVPDDALRVITLDQHHAGAGAHIAAHGGQRHGVGFGHLAADGLAQPQLKLLERVGVRVRLAELGALVALTKVLQMLEVTGFGKFGHTDSIETCNPHDTMHVKNPTKNLPKNVPTVLILASGRGERFLASGGATHKLKALLADKPVLQHTLDAVKASGLPWHLEDEGHPGMGDSIAAAVRKTPDAAGWLVLPADLPLIQPATLLQVAQALQTHPVVLPCYAGADGTDEPQRGHPVGFSAVCKQDLLNLKGNKGAAGVIVDYAAIKLVVNDVGMVTDIDTVDDLARAEAVLKSR